MINLVKKLFGTQSDREVKKLLAKVEQINKVAEDLKFKSNDELQARTKEMQFEIAEQRELLESPLKEKNVETSD